MDQPPTTGDGTADASDRYDIPGYIEPSVRVVEAVAAETDRDPRELPPLQTVVDTDALNAILTGNSTALTLRFEYADRTVKLGHGEIHIAS